MLIEFSVENFKSLRDRTTFSMVASNYYKSHKNNLFKLKELDDNLLRTSILYGPNASGKTNILLSLHILKRIILLSHLNQKGDNLFYEPFRLDDSYVGKPTKFDITFIHNGTKYNYYLAYNNESVIEEKLYYWPKGRKSIIFERDELNSNKKYHFTKDKSKQKDIAERTLENVLYLSSSTKDNYKKTTEAFYWFKDILSTVGPANSWGYTKETIQMMEKNEKIKKLIIKSLMEADLGISDVFYEEKPLSFDNIPESIRKPMEALKEGLQTLIAEKNRDLEIPDSGSVTSVFMVHTGKNKKGSDKKIKFSLQDEESEGTERMFKLIGPCIDALYNGKVLILDEFDTKLHHFLQLYILGLFNDSVSNKKNAQLISTTHNLNLLDQDIFRRDQIWFTKKDYNKGYTLLYPLSDFKERGDKDILKAYETGRYGAIPYIRKK